jgi:hypothetical protein
LGIWSITRRRSAIGSMFLRSPSSNSPRRYASPHRARPRRPKSPPPRPRARITQPGVSAIGSAS